MNYYVSYFYMIRFMPVTMLPVSTAVWDPKWFHENLGPNHIYVDKRGVLNGVRINVLNCSTCYEKDTDCQASGNTECAQVKDGTCTFMRKYGAYLDSLNFWEVISRMENSVQRLHSGIEDICLIVHEKPDCLCAERPVLREWFAKNGLALPEFTKVQAILTDDAANAIVKRYANTVGLDVKSLLDAYPTGWKDYFPKQAHIRAIAEDIINKDCIYVQDLLTY